MTTNDGLTHPGDRPGYVTETVIRHGALALVLIWCFEILRSFIIPMVWATIIAAATHPLYEKLAIVLRGRDKLEATLVAVMLLALLLDEG